MQQRDWNIFLKQADLESFLILKCATREGTV